MEGYLTLTVLVATACAAVIWMRLPYVLAVDVPPGPPLTGWLSGHFSILPSTKPWKVYTEWANKYGTFGGG